MMNLVSKILELICNFINLKIKKENQRIKHEEKTAKQKQSLQDQKEEAQKAIFNGDVDTINKILNSSKSFALLFATSVLFLSGCYTEKVIYVPNDRQVKKLNYEGVDGYFVPTTVMNELLQAKIESKYYREYYERNKSKENIK